MAPDYHVAFDEHYYSVSYRLLGQQLELRATETTIEILRHGKSVACHPRSYFKGGYTTKTEHMPRGHREHAEWTPQRIIGWAKKVGPQTGALVEAIMASKKHPEHGFKRCLGILRLRKQYADDRIEGACDRALRHGMLTYKQVKAILQNNLDRQAVPEPQAPPQMNLPLRQNVRGGGYYH